MLSPTCQVVLVSPPPDEPDAWSIDAIIVGLTHMPHFWYSSTWIFMPSPPHAQYWRLTLVPVPPFLSLLDKQVRYHDIHHWYPECNYGQYTMLWDWLMGSLKPYPVEKSGANREENGGGGRNAATDAALAGKAVAENKEKAG